MKHREMLKLMGQIVTVKATTHSAHVYPDLENLTDIKKVWTRTELEKPRAGWVVGFRTVQEGDYNKGWSGGWTYFGDFNEGRPSFLSNIKPVKIIIVTFWPTMKPVYVLYDDFELGGIPESPHKISEDMKDHIKEYFRSCPRDEKGRFIKEATNSG